MGVGRNPLMRRFGILFAGLAIVLAPLPAIAADVTLFAAASLADAMNEIAKDYSHDKGKTVAVSLAASSVLARQIEASAGADIFISADMDWMDYLDNKGLIDHASRENLLGNQLVLVAAKDSKLQLTIAPHFNLGAALKGGRLAIADPDSVPAGKYGRTALTALGAWDGVKDH